MFHICQNERSRSRGVPDKIGIRRVVAAGDAFGEKVFVRFDFSEIGRVPLPEEPGPARVRPVLLFAFAMPQVLPVSSGAQDGFWINAWLPR
jgi:hypothetical protein